MSASCLQQKFMSSSGFLSLFLRSFASFSILFLQAKLGECVVLWFASWTPSPLKWLTEQKNPFEVCKHAARYNEFGCKLLFCLFKPIVFLVSFVAILLFKLSTIWRPSNHICVKTCPTFRNTLTYQACSLTERRSLLFSDTWVAAKPLWDL